MKTRTINDIIFFSGENDNGISMMEMSEAISTAEKQYQNKDPIKGKRHKLTLAIHLGRLFGENIAIGSPEKIDAFYSSPEYQKQFNKITDELENAGIKRDVATFMAGQDLGMSAATLLIQSLLVNPENPVFTRLTGFQTLIAKDQISAPMDESDRNRCRSLFSHLKNLIPVPESLIEKMIAIDPDNKEKWKRVLEKEPEKTT